jgi:hypothetical protein
MRMIFIRTTPLEVLVMDSNYLQQYLSKNWFLIALVILVFFGYTYGKDRALRDNATDDRAALEVAPAP